MLFDTHSHLNFKDFDKDRYEVIEKCFKEQVFLINIGSDYETSRFAVEIAEKYKEGVYASIALHPIHAKDEKFDYEKYKNLAISSKKVVAIGETGLDEMYPNEAQKQVFEEHLRLARELDLPIILHCRKAHLQLMNILKFHASSFKFHGVAHCFTGAWKEAQEYLNLGFYLGFNGIIFKMNLDEAIKKAPLEKMLLETDCPYLVPQEKGVKLLLDRNEPVNVKYVAKRIAEIRQEPIEKITQATTQNAKRLFGL